MSTLNVTEARSKLYGLIDEAATTHRPVVITGKRANAVLVSQEDWEAIPETLYLLSVPGMREAITAGMNEPLSSARGNWSGDLVGTLKNSKCLCRSEDLPPCSYA